MPTLGDKIEHVIVLMLENRSFSHMLGFVPGVGDLAGTESNPSAWGEVTVTDRAEFVLPIGPDHSHLAVMRQLENGNRGFVLDYAKRIQAEQTKRRKKKKPELPLPPEFAKSIMDCFATDRVPVLATLAQQYVTIRSWFSSVPGETWPNRNYAHSGTSDGQVNIKTKFYRTDTIFELLGRNRRSWRIYHDGPAQTWAFHNLWLPIWRHRFKGMKQLYNAIRENKLDTYSFIEPDHGLLPYDKTSNNQHPENNSEAKRNGRDFRAGEQLIADIYNALKKKDEVFKKTLLVITYDEHGGFFDPVVPPAAILPDGKIWTEGTRQFGFDRLGVRVPAVLVSPWLNPGVIDTPIFDHSSIVSSLRQRFAPDAPPLLARDAVANSFLQLGRREAPRDDRPSVAPNPLEAEAEHGIALKARTAGTSPEEPDLDEFQRSLVSLTDAVSRRLDAEARAPGADARSLTGYPVSAPKTITRRFATQAELGAYMEYVTKRFHRAIDQKALDLTDEEGHFVERPDRETIVAAIDRLRRGRDQGAEVSLRNANDLVVTVDSSGAVRRVDLESGHEQHVPGRPVGFGVAAEELSSAHMADIALEALGRSDIH